VRSELVIYSRARCGVCRRAEAQVRRELRSVLPWRRPAVRIVDIDHADPATGSATGAPAAGDLVARYSVRVPVVTLDGRELRELELAPGVVRAALQRRRPA
jgi:hypothetical protein